MSRNSKYSFVVILLGVIIYSLHARCMGKYSFVVILYCVIVYRLRARCMGKSKSLN